MSQIVLEMHNQTIELVERPTRFELAIQPPPMIELVEQTGLELIVHPQPIELIELMTEIELVVIQQTINLAFERVLLISGPVEAAIAEHAAALDPHGDRAYTDEQIVANTGFAYRAEFGDSTPALIFALVETVALDRVTIHVVYGWDGIGAQVRIGTADDPDALFAAGELELGAIGIFEKDFYLAGPETLHITITPGFGATRGAIIIQGSLTQGA